MKKKFLILILIALVYFFAVPNFSVQAAGPWQTFFSGLKDTGASAGFQLTKDGAPKKDIVLLWIGYLNGLLVLIGAMFMILMLWGGWLWMTARGGEQQVERAKTLLIQATIGFGIIISARIITELIIFSLGQASTL